MHTPVAIPMPLQLMPPSTAIRLDERDNLERQLVEHLEIVDRLSTMMARRNGLTGEDIADFVAWVRLALVQNDYAILRRFRGESTLRSYLAVVIAMLARDHRIERAGRWRPSAAARRLGAVAVQLERLTGARGYSLDEAIRKLRESGETDLDDRALAKLFTALPRRVPLRPMQVDVDALEFVPTSYGADDELLESTSRQERAKLSSSLDDWLSTRNHEDRVIIRLRFWEDAGVADIARALSIPQKPLYRRLEGLLTAMRAALFKSGVNVGQLHELLDTTEASHELR